jgi:outer membrane protein OmpA-like peptidoglycan-associated protein
MIRACRSHAWVAALLMVVGACAKPPQPEPHSVTTVHISAPLVTVLEAPKSIPMTQLETGQAASSSTTTVVERTLSELNAQKTNTGIRINLPDNILFDFDQADIRPNAKPTLAKLDILLRNYSKAPVSIYGHTDSKGRNDYNQTLSEQRAEAVKDFLSQTFGIDAERLTTKGFGQTQPIAPNTQPDGTDNPEGRQKNRRVEVIIHNQ